MMNQPEIRGKNLLGKFVIFADSKARIAATLIVPVLARLYDFDNDNPQEINNISLIIEKEVKSREVAVKKIEEAAKIGLKEGSYSQYRRNLKQELATQQ